MKKALITLSTGFATSYAFIATAIATGGGITITNSGGAAGAASQTGTSITNLLTLAQGIVTKLVPLFIGVAVVVFFWFLIQFILKGAADPTKRSESLKGMGFSILALFVMVSIWGLVGFIGSFFGIGQGGSVPVPCLPGPTGDCQR